MARPTRVQRNVAEPPKPAERGPLNNYLAQRGQTRTVPAPGADGSLQDVVQSKPDPEARLARARKLGHRPPGAG